MERGADQSRRDVSRIVPPVEPVFEFRQIAGGVDPSVCNRNEMFCRGLEKGAPLKSKAAFFGSRIQKWSKENNKNIFNKKK